MTNPSPALITCAFELHRTGQLASAAALYEQILQANPGDANALHLLGLIVRDGGDPSRAVELFTRAIAANPSVAAFRLNRGLALRALNRADEALVDFDQARAMEPTLAEAHHQAGNVLKQLGLFPTAIAAFRQAVNLAPSLAPAWLNLGVACLENHNPAEAIHAFRQAIALEPARAEAHNILGVALLASGQASSARSAFTASLRLNPSFAPAHDNLGRLCKAEGELEEAIRQFRAALATRPENGTHSNLLLALNYLSSLAPAEVFAEHRRWNELYAARLTPNVASTQTSSATIQVHPLIPSNPPEPTPGPIPPRGRRLRIGYVSPDFCHHAVAYFIAPVLAAHDRNQVEVFCYANVANPDRVTDRLRNLPEHWRDIARLNDDSAATLVREDKIDLLIDLAGHTAGNRLLIFARRPARVQATWLGYPNTTGLDSIDFRLTDGISDPLGETDAFYAEQLFRLPSTFSCYEPDPTAPAVNRLPASTAGAITFGCFNNFAKITPEVIELWARLLRPLPSAKLFLKSRGLGDAVVASRIHLAFAKAGVTPERVILNGEELSVADHLRLYHQVDVALDPFPYNGTTTTCEALWMGVPVLTLASQTHAARVGASLLTHVGLPEWIATTPDDYLSLAVTAAGDLPRLANLRRALRERMQRSPLCNAQQFTRELESAYATMVAGSFPS